MQASFNGHIDIVLTLLNAGADANHFDSNGISSLIATNAGGHRGHAHTSLVKPNLVDLSFSFYEPFKFTKRDKK